MINKNYKFNWKRTLGVLMTTTVLTTTVGQDTIDNGMIRVSAEEALETGKEEFGEEESGEKASKEEESGEVESKEEASGEESENSTGIGTADSSAENPEDSSVDSTANNTPDTARPNSATATDATAPDATAPDAAAPDSTAPDSATSHSTTEVSGTDTSTETPSASNEPGNKTGDEPSDKSTNEPGNKTGDESGNKSADETPAHTPAFSLKNLLKSPILRAPSSNEGAGNVNGIGSGNGNNIGNGVGNGDGGNAGDESGSASWVIYVNGKAASAEQSLEIPYKHIHSMEVRDGSGNPVTGAEILYADPNGDPNADGYWHQGYPELPASTPWRLGATTEEDDNLGTTSDQVLIRKATPAAPENISWVDQDGNIILTWDAVTLDNVNTSDQDGPILLEAGAIDSYKILLKLDGSTVDTLTAKIEEGAVSGSLDVTEKIQQHGIGSYTAEIQALVSDAKKHLYNNGDAAGSEAYVREDTTAPVISGITANEDTQRIEIHAKDADSALAGYQLSEVADTADLDAAQWIAITGSSKDEDIILEATPTEAGTYYVYVKDAAGNIARSTDSITITKVTLTGLYDGSIKLNDQVRYLFGTGSFKLPETESRTGYSFGGWKERGAEQTLSAITKDGDTHTISAVWSFTNVTITLEHVGTSAATTRVYDGTETFLHAKVSDDYGVIVTYKWYRKGPEDADYTEVVPYDSTAAEAGYLSLKNVSDSGTYKVAAFWNMGEDESPSLESTDTIEVSISNAALTLKADDKTITYGDEAPNYTYNTTGLVNGEEAADVLSGGSLSCTYEKGSAETGKRGSYEITPTGFTADNYDVTLVPGTLTVNPKDVNAEGSGVTMELQLPEEGYYTYDGQAHEPAVTVRDGEKELTAGADYTVSYRNQISASESADADHQPTVTVTFTGTGSNPTDSDPAGTGSDPAGSNPTGDPTRTEEGTGTGNYTGTLSETYLIKKAAFTAQLSLESWTYDGTAHTPVLSTNPSGGKVTYHYSSVTGETETDLGTTAPKAAGDYRVYAVIAETTDYQSFTTEPVSYTISKVKITLTAASDEKEYDGNTLTANSYTQEGSFVGSDDFQAVTVSGSITDVGDVPNVVSYSLTTAAKAHADSYDIVCVDGTLKITQKPLSTPANLKWDSTKAGTASWIAITRTGLEVTYEVTLYKNGEQLGNPIQVTGETEYDFSEIIKAQEECAGYTFSVKALPSGGEKKDNYSDGEMSDQSRTLYTAKVTIQGMDAGESPEGTESVLFDDGTQSRIMMAGEKAEIQAVLKPGYVVPKSGSTFWTYANATAGVDATASFANANATTTTFQVGSLSDCADLNIFANARDEEPSIGKDSFRGVPAEDNKSAVLSFTAADSKKLTGWMITKQAEGIDVDAEGWNAVDAASIDADVTKTTITEKGAWYAWVKDDGGNVVRSEAPVSLYEISFDANTGDGSMESLLKVQDIALKIPENTYTRAGFAFKNWVGDPSQLTYEDQGTIELNADDILKAQWTDEKFSYTVKYYFMNDEGQYPEEDHPSDTKTFKSPYGTTIASGDRSFQQQQEGLTLDTAEERTESFTITQNGVVLHIYYKRATHKITYKWTDEKGVEKNSVQEYVYGAPVTELEKPAADGYTFVGWIWEKIGSKPEKMPDEDLTATGSFKAQDATYQITYYQQNLKEDGTPADSYALVSSQNTKLAKQGDEITAKLSEARLFDGFTPYAVAISEGGVSGAELPDTAVVKGEDQEAEDVSVTGTASAVEGKTLYINYYYTRNSYSITLKVWKDFLSNVQFTHTWEKLYYGTKLTADTYANYGSGEEGDTAPADTKWPEIDGFEVADYVDWSTGSEPTSMPAGDVTLTREYVSTRSSQYAVSIYAEQADGSFDYLTGYSYVGNIGSTAVLDQERFEHYRSIVPELAYYELDAAATKAYADEQDPASMTWEDGTLSGKITDTRDSYAQELRFHVYYRRRSYETKINYYYIKAGETEQIHLGTLTRKEVWGRTLGYEPLILFEGGSDPENAVSEDGRTATTWTRDQANPEFATGNSSFLEDGYVVSYSGYYRQYEGAEKGATNHWPTARYVTTTQLKEDKASYPAGVHSYTEQNGVKVEKTDVNYVNVYYTQVKTGTEDRLTLNIVSDRRALKKGAGTSPLTVTQPMQVEYNGELYTVRVRNKVDLVQYTTGGEEGDTEGYPGAAALLNRDGLDYTYKTDGDGNLLPQPGYERVSISYTTQAGKTSSYDLFLETGDTEKVLYLPDEQNRLFVGNLLDIGYGTGTLPRDMEDDFLTGYKVDHGTGIEDHTDPAYDAMWEGAYLHNASARTILVKGHNPTLTFSYNYQDYCQLYFVMDGVSETTIDHQFLKGSIVPKEKVTCNLFAEKEGYTIHWYRYSDFTGEPESFRINEDTTVFGRYERSEYASHDTRSYELADTITLRDGTEASYVTRDNLEAVREVLGTALEASVVTREASYTDEFDTDKTLECKTTTYSYKGEVVLVDTEFPTRSFTLASIADTYRSAEYLRDGFHFDDLTSLNHLQIYVKAEPVTLTACYARDRYELSVNENVTKSRIVTTYEEKFGQTIDLATPNKPGYELTAWKWSKWDADRTAADGSTGDWTDYTPAGTQDGRGAFSMPALTLLAEAQWKPASNAITVYHYFQTTERAYDADTVSALRAGSGESVGLSINGESAVTATKIAGLGYVVSTTDEHGSTVLAYYGNPNADNDVTTSDLLAIAEPASIITDTEQEIDPHIQDAAADSIFQYAYTSAKNDEAVLTLKRGETYTYLHGMNLTYYYERQSNCRIYATAKVDDRDDHGTGAVLVGGGEHYYGEQVTLNASVAPGYSFMGWFRAEDVLDEFDDAARAAVQSGEKSLNDYALSENWQQQTPVQPEASFPMTMTESVFYVAVTTAAQIQDVSAVISGPSSFTYGYASKADNALKIVATVPDSAVSVRSYQWYAVAVDEAGTRIRTKIAGAISPTYLIPVGKDAGTYTYSCDLEVYRTDNDRTMTITAPDYAIEVKPADMSVSTSEYSGVYDGREHAASLKVNNPAEGVTIYYSTKTPLTAENYLTAETTAQMPSFKDVLADANGKVQKHPVYYYIVQNVGDGETKNFNDKAGTTYVTLTPAMLTIKAAGGAFTKFYDGTAHVEGDLTNTESDKYRLANSANETGTLYTVTGFLAPDKMDVYLLDFDASFDNKHAGDATSVTLDDPHLVVKDNPTTRMDNYKFQVETLILSGDIEPRKLDVIWSDTDFVYDGTEKKPTVALKEEVVEKLPAEDKAIGITLAVAGGQTNASGPNGYTATAQVEEPTAEQIAQAGATDPYKPGDYTFTEINCRFDIRQAPITVTPVDVTVPYDRKLHRMTEYRVAGLWSEDETPVFVHSAEEAAGMPGVVAWITDGEAKTDVRVADGEAKPYELPARDIQIFRGGKNATDNYAITLANGRLTITPKPVTVSGITAADKNYDGNTSAVISVEKAVFDGLIAGDSLALDPEKVSGVFENAAAGTGKTVNLTIAADAMTGSSADNYHLDVDGSQKTTTASILKNPVTVKPVAQEIVYGQTNPEMSVTYSGWTVLSQDAEGAPEEVTGTPVYYLTKIEDANGAAVTDAAAEVYDPAKIYDAGVYKITLGTEGMSTPDHTIVASEETVLFNVTRRPVLVEKNQSITKLYDGTTDATLARENYQFSAVEGKTESGVLAQDADTLDLVNAKAVYNSKDVARADSVSVSGYGLNDSNYVLENESFVVDGSITPRAVVMTAKDKTVEYGIAKPDFEVAFSLPEGQTAATAGMLEGEESIYTPQVEYTCVYRHDDDQNKHIGTYDIVPAFKSDFVDGTDGSVAYQNYIFTIVKGTLEVTKKKITVTVQDQTVVYGAALPENSVKMSGWVNEEAELEGCTLEQARAVAGLIAEGDITYLYETKAGAAITDSQNPVGEYVLKGTSTLESGNYEYEMVPGKLSITPKTLYVKSGIKVADKLYDGTAQVLQSQIDTTSIVYEGLLPEDNTEAAGIEVYTEDHKGPAGETSVYTGSNVSATDGTVNPVTVSLAYTLNAYLAERYELNTTAEDRQQTATSKIVPMPLVMQPADKTISYAADAPAMTAVDLTFPAETVANPLDPEQTVKAGFVNGETIATAPMMSGTATFTFTRDQAPKKTYEANDPVSYEDATGAESVSYSITVGGYTSSNYSITCKPGILKVTPLQFAAPLSATVTMAGWQYGASRNAYSITDVTGGEAVLKQTVQYSRKGEDGSYGAWITIEDKNVSKGNFPTDAGTYKLRVFLNTENYSTGYPDEAEYTPIESEPFTITPAVLANPANVKADATAGYGLFTWDAVTGPVENNGAPDSKSHILVGYEVELYKQAAGEETATKVATRFVTDTQIQSADVMTELAEYTAKVKAVVIDSSNAAKLAEVSAADVTAAGSSRSNCADSGWVAASGSFELTGGILAEGGLYEKMYDGTPIILSVDSNAIIEGKTRYQWRRNGNVIPAEAGGNGETFPVTYVRESGSYSCDLINPTDHGDVTFHVLAEEVTITPRPIGVRPLNLTRVYDGTALTAEDITLPSTATDAREKALQESIITSDLKLAVTDTMTVAFVATDETMADGSSSVTPPARINAGVTATKIASVTIAHKTAPEAGSKAADGSARGPQYELNAEGSAKAGNDYAVVCQSGSITIEKAVPTFEVKLDETAATAPKAAGAGTPAVDHWSADTTYDGTEHALTASVTGGGTITFTDMDPAAGITDADTYQQKPAGQYTVTIKAAESQNYKAAETTCVINIAKRPVTLTAKDQTSVYGEAMKSLTGAYTITAGGTEEGALAPGDTLNSIALTTTAHEAREASGDQPAVAPSDAGAYPITFVTSDPADPGAAEPVYKTANPNYDITVVPGTYTITKAEQVLTASADNHVYDAQPHAVTGTLTKGDGTIRYVGTQPAVAEAGSYAQIHAGTYQVTVKASETTNYKPAQTTATLTITKAPITITVQNAESVFYQPLADMNGADAYWSITEGGLLDGDQLRGMTVITDATSTSPVTDAEHAYKTTLQEGAGGYAVSNPDYEITVVDGVYTLKPATLIYTAVPYDGVYDKSAHSITVNVSAPGSTASVYYAKQDGVDLTTDNYTDAEVASTTPTGYTDVKGDEEAYTTSFYIKAENYLPVAVPASKTGETGVRIRKAGQTITADPVTVPYDAEPHALHATTSGDGAITFIGTNPDVAEADRYEQTEIGSYAVTVKAAETQNYKATEQETTLTVTKRPITLTGGEAHSTYGSEVEEVTDLWSLTKGSLVDGTSLAGVTMTTTATRESRAGKYPITFEDPEALAAANPLYDITLEDGTYTVDPLPLTITVGDAESVYMEPLADLKNLWHVTEGELLRGDALTGITVVTDATVGSHVSDAQHAYKTTLLSDAAAGAEGTDAAGNEGRGYESANPDYAITVVDGVYTVKKAPNKWTQDPAIKGWLSGKQPNLPSATAKFGEPVYTYSKTRDGVYTPDLMSESSPAGTYYMKAVVPDTANYEGLETIVPFVVEDITDKPTEGTGSTVPLVDEDGRPHGKVTTAVLKEISSEVIEVTQLEANLTVAKAKALLGEEYVVKVLQDDKDAIIYLLVQNVNEEDPGVQEDEARITEIAGARSAQVGKELKNGLYFDLSLYKRITGEPTFRIRNVDGTKAEITMTLGEGLRDKEAYYIIYSHRAADGHVETGVIEPTVNGADLDFETDHFSTYSLWYVDKSGKPDTPVGPKPDTPADPTPAPEPKPDTPETPVTPEPVPVVPADEEPVNPYLQPEDPAQDTTEQIIPVDPEHPYEHTPELVKQYRNTPESTIEFEYFHDGKLYEVVRDRDGNLLGSTDMKTATGNRGAKTSDSDLRDHMYILLLALFNLLVLVLDERRRNHLQ